MSDPTPPTAIAVPPRGSVLFKVTAFSLALTLLFTLVTNILPQVEGEAPTDELVEVGALTMQSFVVLGERVFRGKGTCTLCHNDLDRAPDLLVMNVAEVAADRLADERYRGAAQDAGTYLRESMLAPSAYVVTGYGKKGSNDAVSPMPAVDKPPIQLSSLEIDAIVAFLQAKDGNEVSVALPEVTTQEISADATTPSTPITQTPAVTPEEAVSKFGCAACHTMLDSHSPVGPSLEHIGARMDAAALRESIVNPGASIAEGFPAGVMPGDFATRMTVSELELLLEWLVRQQ